MISLDTQIGERVKRDTQRGQILEWHPKVFAVLVQWEHCPFSNWESGHDLHLLTALEQLAEIKNED